jgi:hypothetical protein
MPIKPEKPNPFWPMVPKERRALFRLVVIAAIIFLALVVARFAARILLG